MMAVETLASPPVAVPAAVQADAPPVVRVSVEEYLAQYADQHYEWAGGVLSKMSPVSLKHDALVRYLSRLFEAYLALNPIGTVAGEPFVMRLPASDSFREPDLQLILKTNPGQLTDTAMIGPADLCIEVVSPESTARDYGYKFEEYEKGGVREYWIVDPVRRQAIFYRLQPSGLYTPAHPDAAGAYTTPLLPRLALHVPTLWQEPLPDYFATGQAVQTMWSSGE